MSDAKGALVLLAEMPRAMRLLGDKGYDADWLRDELKARGVRVGIPARSGRNRPATRNRKLSKKRCRIEIAFVRLKDWRGISTRYARCGDLSLSAITLAATAILRLQYQALTVSSRRSITWIRWQR